MDRSEAETHAQWRAYDQAKRFYDAYRDGRAYYDREEYEQALAIYTSVAEMFPDKPEVFLHIASMYQKGQGAQRDERIAQRWIERAAAAGLAEAQFYLSGILFKQGVDDKATALLECAARQGHAPSLYHLGRLYETGTALSRDRGRAVDCFKKAAAAGHLLAERELALSLVRGEHGLFGIPLGIARLAVGFFKTWRTVAMDPLSERVQ